MAMSPRSRRLRRFARATFIGLVSLGAPTLSGRDVAAQATLAPPPVATPTPTPTPTPEPAPAPSEANVPTTSGPNGPPPPDASPAEVLVPPQALDTPLIEYPADGPPLTEPLEVVAELLVDDKGVVTEAQLAVPGDAAVDRAVLEGVKRLRFSPATAKGQPITVRIAFTQRFEPAPAPAPAPIEAGQVLDAVLEGTVQARGTRAPIARATVAATNPETKRDYTTSTDAHGAFRLAVPSGVALGVRVVALEYEKFRQREQLAANETLKVKYLLTGKSYTEFETVVRGKVERTETSRTTLSGREITRVPGTFGDPFRVVNVLPGVTSMMSLLPLPVVRGSSPGDTGYFLDGIRLPMLFHLFGGPSVIHPEFIDRVDFYPGGFPVTYGGYTGGIIDGHTRSTRPDERRLDLDLNLTQAGGLVRTPIEPLGMTATVAGRYGYPGILLSLLTPDVSLSYWDYQTRFDKRVGNDAWSAFFYGADDRVKVRPAAGQPLRTVIRFTFHRADLRYRHGDDANHIEGRLVLGYDDSTLSGGDGPVAGSSALGNGSWSAGPALRAHRAAFSWLDLDAGLDSVVRTVKNPASSATATSAAGSGSGASQIFNSDGYFVTSGTFVEAAWKPNDDWRIMPGVRADLYNQQRTLGANVQQWNVDPRLLIRYRLSEAEAGGTTLKGVVGRYHQPPRLFMPLPGLDASSLELGLLASTQYSIGAETKLGPSLESDVNVYYNDMNPVLFDFATNPSAADAQQPQPTLPPWQAPSPTPGTDRTRINDLFVSRQGRSYGLEVLVRRRDAERLFGWVSYTLSRSERRTTSTWELFDYDRLHVLNLVAGLRLPRNWEVGGRAMLQSGSPLTTIFGRNLTRSAGQFRFDLRIDKRAVWDKWLLDFYVDIINTTVAAESGGLIGGSAIRYIIPTIGLRGVL